MTSLARRVLIALWIFTPVAAAAQQEHAVISGTVRGRSQQSVAGAHITVPRLNIGTLTNEAGTYRLVVPLRDARSAETLRVTSLGYKTTEQQVTLRAGGMTVDFTIAEDAIQLEQVVVTGTAFGSQQRRAQAAQIASVNAAEITAQAPVTSVQEILQSRVAGVSLTQTSGSSGTSQQIRIRGNSSISLNNEPVFFIDGVQADSRSRGTLVTGGQAISRLFDLNPEDIESIEIVKGPAAATLFGADASAGVIQIITKRGKAGTNSFAQTIGVEYNTIENLWTPPGNFGRCRAVDTIPDTPCRPTASQQLPAGSIVSDNPLLRESVFRRGELKSLSWSGRGGGASYGYFLSLNNDREDGTLPNNFFERRSARVNFNWVPNNQVSLDAGFGLVKALNDLPINDNNIFGYLGGALLGNPLNRGRASNGWYAPFRTSEVIETVQSISDAVRVTPTMTLKHTPLSWLSHRITIGGDLTRDETRQHFPKNAGNWWGGDTDLGTVTEGRNHNDIYTIDYQANLRRAFGPNDRWTTDFTTGAQLISTRTDQVTATGTKLVTNAARVISAATQISATQAFAQQRALGFLGNLAVGWNNRAFLQLGARIDQNSSFGDEAPTFFLPRAGLSYVVSEEPFFAGARDVVNTLRLRAAWGTTGRNPGPGAALETYAPNPFAISTTISNPGVTPNSPGNRALKAERGTEIELGADFGFFNDRLGADITYFNKTSSDLLLQVPLPPSHGFAVNPFRNIGKVTNSGIEASLRATLISGTNLGWEARAVFNTLHNELLELGEVAAFGAVTRFNEGFSLGYWNTQKILSVDTIAGRTIVTDTSVYVGELLPTFEGNVGSTITILRNIRIFGQVDWKLGHKLLNNTDEFRERQFGTGERRVRQDEILSKTEKLERFGPFVTAAGVAVSPNSVLDRYIQDGSLVRFRELSATYTVPAKWVQKLGATGASIQAGVRNLKLWTDYEGVDPEIISTANAAFQRSDFLTVPQPRRIILRTQFSF